MAANTASDRPSSASAQAKNAAGLVSSASCHEATITIGTSTTVSRISSRPSPSTPSA